MYKEHEFAITDLKFNDGFFEFKTNVDNFWLTELRSNSTVALNSQSAKLHLHGDVFTIVVGSVQSLAFDVQEMTVTFRFFRLESPTDTGTCSNSSLEQEFYDRTDSN